MKCKYHEKCKFYNNQNMCCLDDTEAKNYYGAGKPCGCYMKMQGANERSEILPPKERTI